MTDRNRVVIVGSSLAATKTVQSLRSAGFSGELLVIGEEWDQPYDKPPLSKGFLAGAVSEVDIALLEPGAWSTLGVEVLSGVPAVALDTTHRDVELADGRRIPYDNLVIATGARARPLVNESGAIVAGGLRTLADAKHLRARITADSSVVVVGGGFVGAEVAATVRQLGCATTVIEATETPFTRVIGPVAGSIVAEAHRDNGVDLISGAEVTAVERFGDRFVVRLADSTAVEADVVLAAIGVIPNTEWLVGSGATIDNGVVTDEFCRVVGLDGVYALGDVARWFDMESGAYRRVEHWTNAADQAVVVARNIVDDLVPTRYVPAPYFWSDQFDLKIQMVGEVPRGVADLHEYSEGRRRAFVYSVGDRFVSAITINWPRAMVALRRAAATQADTQTVLDTVNTLLDQAAAALSR